MIIIIKKPWKSRIYTNTIQSSIHSADAELYTYYSSGKLFMSIKKKSAIEQMMTGAHTTKDRKLSIIKDTNVCYRRHR